MAVLARGGLQGGPIPVPVATSGNAATNPNSYAVLVTVTKVDGATISAVTVGSAQVGTGPGTYVVPAAGTITTTYTGSITYATSTTGLQIPTQYPYSDPVYQLGFTVQQFLAQPGIDPRVTDT